MLNNIILRNQADQNWLQFIQPIEVLVARTVAEVLSVLQEVEGWNTRGYYAAGYLSYEASAAFDAALVTHPEDDFPLAVFGIYTEPVISDQLLVNPCAEPEVPLKTQNPQLKTPLNWQQSITQKEYFHHFQSIQNAIQRGDTYQVNFSLRQFANFSDDPFSLFQNMAATAPYAAFLDLEQYAICSASPELFFSKKGNRITTRPMKGTAARGRTNTEDQKQVEWLKNSAKDRAENVMIVDMIRNDLGRIATPGTVEFPHLYSIEKYPTVWQMTSTVTAQTAANLTELMTALFPCASITGAPKTGTMHIIREQENTPRHIYTGTIGYCAPNGDMQFSVAIRTGLIDKQLRQLEYGTGGGITAQSEVTKEYSECQLKTKIIQEVRPDFELLETMLWTPEEGIYLLPHHLERVVDSSIYFDYKIDISKIENALSALNFSTTQKLRLLVARDGAFEIENYSIQEVDHLTWEVALALQPVDSNDAFLFHKTTHRVIYQQHLKQQPDFKDVILYNEKGELTESCFGNLVIEKDGAFYTPPINCGLLNGTMRRELMSLSWMREETLYAEDLAEADQVFIINSVRKFIKAKLSQSATSIAPLMPQFH